MKRVTRNNLIKLVEMMKEYQKTQNQDLRNNINDSIENVINKDSRYYTKLKSYDFEEDILKYLI